MIVMANSIIQFRIDEDLKAQATAIYDKLGIDLSTAIRMFLKRSVYVNGIPFSMVLPAENEKNGLRLLNEMNIFAQNNGVSDLSLDEINNEIAAYRRNKGEVTE